MTIAARKIRVWMIQNDHTQVTLAKMLGISRQAISNYLRGVKPHPNRILEIYKLTRMEIGFADWYAEELTEIYNELRAVEK